jgi:hypothetical protein
MVRDEKDINSMTDRTKEILTFLDALANEYGLKFEKENKRKIEDAIKIISRLELEPPEDVKHFDIPAGLDNAKGYIPSAEQPEKKE